MRTARWAAAAAPAGLVLVLAGCSTIQQEADDRAAQVADAVLPGELEKEINATGSTTLEARVEAARDWLSTPDQGILNSQGPVTWVVRETEGAAVRVDVYAYVESASFFPPDQGESEWGVACRSYDLDASVTVIAFECPDGTPETP